MRHLLWVFAILFVAGLIRAQDGADSGRDAGIFGDGGLFAGGAAAAGNRGARGQAPGADRLLALKTMLAKADAAMSNDQEKSINALLDREIKSMSDAFQTKFGTPLAAAAGAQRGARGSQAQPAGQAAGQGERGPGPRSGAADEIRRMNEELLAKVVASLNPDQQAVVLKLQKDQTRARGGLEALKLVLSDAGASPLNADQLPQIESLYAEQSQARSQLARESQGQADPAKINQLELEIMTKIVRILRPDQRKALLDAMKK